MKKNIVLISPNKEEFYKKGIGNDKSNIGNNKSANADFIPDLNLALSQHAFLVEAITKSGVNNIINLDFPNDSLNTFKNNSEYLSITDSGEKKYKEDNIVFSRDGFISNREDKILISNFRKQNRIFESEIIKESLISILDTFDIDREIVSAAKDENLYFEGGDFRFLEEDKLLFAGYNSNRRTSRNSEKGINFVQKQFGIKNNDLLIVESKGYHIDTVFGTITDNKGILIGGLICRGLVENYLGIKSFFKKRGLKLIDIPDIYGVRDPKINPNGNGSINTLNLNEYLISSSVFPPHIEDKLEKIGIKRFITSTSQFWEAGGGPHCLTNEL